MTAANGRSSAEMPKSIQIISEMGKTRQDISQITVEAVMATDSLRYRTSIGMIGTGLQNSE